MSASKRKGSTWEAAIVDYLRANGARHAERRLAGSTVDRGDIAGVPGCVVQAKAAARLDFHTWLDEANHQRDNDRADIGVVWAKRKGKASPAHAYVVMDGATLVRLLAAAGYITTIPSAEG